MAEVERSDLVRLLKEIGVRSDAYEPLIEYITRIVDKEKRRSSLMARYVPTRIRNALDENPDMDPCFGERRHVTVVFVDISGFTTICETLDAERVVEILRRVYDLICTEVDRYGGSVDKYLGDAAMITFGAPVAHSDDPTRALNAALAILSRIRDIAVSTGIPQSPPMKLNASIGIHSGHVVAGNLGGEGRMEYTVIGDAVNVASRLQGLANPGTILVSRTTHDMTAEDFLFQSKGEMQLKGRFHPIEVFTLVRQVRRRNTDSIHTDRFIGRDLEMERLDRWFDALIDRRSLNMIITSPPGFGKTRLIEQWIERNRGKLQVVWCKGELEFREAPLEALSNALNEALTETVHQVRPKGIDRFRALVRLIKPDPISAQKILNDVSLFLDIEQLRSCRFSGRDDLKNHFASLLELMRLVARLKPLVIVIDNLQWLDAVSLEWLRWFLTESSGSSVAFLCISREDHPSLVFDEHMHVGGIGEDTARKFLAKALGSKSDDPRVDIIYKQIGDHPLLLSLLTDHPAIEHVTGFSGSDDLPERFQALIRSRLDELNTECRNTLETASVIGNRSDIKLLSQVCNKDSKSIVHDLHALITAGFFRSDATCDRYSFLHDSVREVVYNGILIRNRKNTHDKIAGVMESVGTMSEYPSSVIAGHFEKGNDPVRSIHYIEKTAQYAARLYEYREAIRLYCHGLEIMDLERAELMVEDWRFRHRVGQLYDRLGASDMSLSYFRNALVTPVAQSDSSFRAQTLVQIGELLSGCGDLPGGIDALQQAYSLFDQSHHAEGMIKALNAIGILYLQTGRLDEARDNFNLSTQRAETLDDPELKGLSYSNLGICYSMCAEYERATQAFLESVYSFESAGRQDGLAQAYHNLGMSHEHMSQYRTAEQYYEKSLDISREIGDREMIAKTLLNRSAVSCSIGDQTTARALVSQAMVMLSELNNPIMTADAYLTMARIHQASGNLRQAKGCAAFALRTNRKLNYRLGIAQSMRQYGRILIEIGRRSTAERYLRSAMEEFTQLNDRGAIADIKETLDKLWRLDKNSGNRCDGSSE